MRTPLPRILKAFLIIVLLLSTSGFGDDRGFDVRPGPAAHEQYGPVLATNGDTWMAVWTDNRSGLFDIYASPLDERGQPRFSEGIPVASTSSCDVGLKPLVEWTGSSYALLWNVGRTIQAARLASDGETVSPPSEIFNVPTQSGVCAIAWDGWRYLVAWPDSDDPYVEGDVHGVLLDANFNQVSPTIRLSAGPLLQPSVGLAGGDGKFLVTMSNRVAATTYETHTAVVADDGSVSPGGVVPGTSGGSLAWNGSEWAMTWGGDDGHVRFTTISSEGVPAGTIAVLPGDWVSGPDVAWDGSEFLVAFSGYRGPLFTIRVSSSGVALDPAPVQLTDTSFAAVSDMSPNARGMLVGWRDYRTGINIFDLLLPYGGAAVIPPEQLLAQSLEEQGSSSIATSGSLGLAVWTELIDSSTPVLRATRVSASGVQLDQPPIEFQRGGMIGDTVVAASADGFLVAWIALSEDGTTRVMAARISRDGSVAEPAFKIGEAVQGLLRVATSGRDFLVVSVVNDGIVGWRLGRSSQDAVRFMIAASPALNVHLWAPDVAFNGSAFVVTWIASTSCGRNCYFQDLYVADLKDGATDHVTKIGTAAGPATLASDGENTFVAWPCQGNVSVALLDQDLRTIAQSEAGDHDMPASLVDATWVGSRWFLTWTAQDSDEYSECIHVSRSHLESASFAPDLSHLTGAQLTAPDDGSHSPSVANAGSSVLLLYERVVPTALALHRGGINRVFLRAIGVPRQRATVR